MPCAVKEINGFLKNVCDDGDPQHILYKCFNSDQFYLHKPNSFPYFEGDICSNDPHHYQACNTELSTKVTNGKFLCDTYLCSPTSDTLQFHEDWLFSTDNLMRYGFLCYSDFDCKNIELDRSDCNSETEKDMSGNICNDMCDEGNTVICKDESLCNGYRYGLFCTPKLPANTITPTNTSKVQEKLTYVPPRWICNGEQSCKDNEDEAGCEVTAQTETVCRHFSTGHLVPVHNYTRCTAVNPSSYSNLDNNISGNLDNKVYCSLEDLYLYQTNCTDPSRVGLTCEIQGYVSTVSHYIICTGFVGAVCDDGIDNTCFAGKSCTIHKHLMCDGRTDCSDKFDETHLICSAKTVSTCRRRVGGEGELQIPVAWLRDGVKDCVDGIDESADWPTCGQDNTLRYKTSDQTTCDNVYLCRHNSPGFVELTNLCDGIETCGNENRVCSVSSRTYSVETSVLTTDKGFTKHLSYCLNGLERLQELKGACVTENFMYPEGDIFGLDRKTAVLVPHNRQVCDDMYGELYLYTSCTGQCSDVTCPLRNIPRYEVCPDQFTRRVGTIVDNKYLIFLTQSHQNSYTNRYFVCDNKIKCIEYSQVCNLVDDCGDNSDETHCTNHFKCNSSEKLIPKSKLCDGNIECSDLSDECNKQCSKQILVGEFLKGLSWIIGTLAFLSNFVIIAKSLRTLKKCRTSVALINRLLIIMIAIGDLLIGCYLLIIATYDRVIFKSYCRDQISWITSLKCSTIGIFSTIGSQVSLFSMTGLSIVRMVGIWRSMRIPGEVTSAVIFRSSGVILSLLFFSITIAVVPIIESFEDFFVNGVKFADGLNIFIGTSSKSTIFAVIGAYYGRTRESTLKWKRLINLVTDMFSHDLNYTDLTEKIEKVSFYGNDGVCLFKYFVQNNDPQRLYVWITLLLNFICFVSICVSYIFIGIVGQKSSNSLRGSENNKHLTQRNKRMNQRIALIITTDFLCWVPFIVICILHSSEIIDATPWYSVFSMVILPINSVINPLLYDEVVTNAFRAPILALYGRIFRSSFLQRSHRGAVTTQTETVELTPRQH